MICVSRIQAETFVQHFEQHSELVSTNDRAKLLAGDSGLKTPALILAHRQTSGRGRGNHTWWSAEGALTFSLLLEPAEIGLNISSWPCLSLTTAVAVCDAIRLEVPQSPLGIKWPNDVLLHGSKVCGILVESPGRPHPACNRLIVGIGINVNNSWNNAPSDVGAGGTALCDITGRDQDMESLLVHLLQAMAERFRQLRERDSQLPQTWRELCLLRGRAVQVMTENHRQQGKCLQIANDGALEIVTSGMMTRHFSGSVTILE